jgi:hypothetical protein
MPDERERAIERRGIVFSHHLLCTGILGVIAATWFGMGLLAVIHTLAFVSIVAEFSRLAIEIYGLRRGY